VADQILEITYARRIMDYFKLLPCLSIEILSVKIASGRVFQLLKLIDHLIETQLAIAHKIMCET
jgi:hypothetical protein